MTTRRRRIPDATVARLPVYLQVLVEQADQSVDSISSEGLAELAGVRAATFGVAGVAAASTVLLFAVSPQLRGLKLSRFH